MPKRQRDFNFEELVKFSMPEKMFHCVKIKVKADGEVYISSSIIESIKKENKEMWVDFRHSEDYKTIAICLKGDRNFKFPRTGTMKFKEWKEILQKFGYAIPAVYFLEWNQEEHMWIGRLQEVSEPPLRKRG